MKVKLKVFLKVSAVVIAVIGLVIIACYGKIAIFRESLY